jgi:putative endonuclease
MTDRRRALGRCGEQLALAQLQAWGWRMRATNWRCPLGEIDIVAEDGEWLVVVEVRTRRGPQFGPPEESIGHSKREKLVTLGHHYVQAVNWQGPWRIDVVAIELDSAGRQVRLVHYANAVEGD